MPGADTYEPLTPVGVERKLRTLVNQLTAAQKALVMGKKKPAKAGVTYTLA